MPRVHGQLSLVTEAPERITEAHVRAPETRALGSGVVTGSPDRVRVENGVFDAVLAPGPCVVTLVSLGVPVQHLRLIVPNNDVSLRAAFEAGLAADAGDRSVLERLAGEAAGALEAAEAATRAAGEAVTAAAGSASEAEQSATAASLAAAAAGKHAGRAGDHAGTAGSYASVAESSASAASASAVGAAGSAGDAQREADRATEQAQAAESSATEASTHADRAEGVVDTVRWDDDKLTVAGKTSPSLRGPKGPKGEQGDSGASTWDAITDKPDVATRQDVEAVRGEVGGKADVEHQHRMSDITDLPQITSNSRANTIMQRDSTGRVKINANSAPTNTFHVTHKRYVDEQDAATLAEAKALIETRTKVELVSTPSAALEDDVLYVIPE